MKLFIIRHGQAKVNVDDWATLEHLDTPLTKLGHEQCEKLRDWMLREKITADALYTSSMVRTVETAAYVEAALGLTAVQDDRLREVGNNRADGTVPPVEQLPRATISNHPGQDPFTSQNPESDLTESWMHVRIRLGRAIRDLRERHKGETVYVVAHGGIMAMMIENILNVPPVRHSVVHTDNTGISHFEWEPGYDGMQWVLRYHNRTPHLTGL